MSKMAFNVQTRCSIFINTYKTESLPSKELSLPCPLNLIFFTVCPHHLVSLSLLQACERDVQCGLGLCCAVSLWLRGLRMCVPRGVEGDECHPFSHKVGDAKSRIVLHWALYYTHTLTLIFLLVHTCFELLEIQISSAGRLAKL